MAPDVRYGQDVQVAGSSSWCGDELNSHLGRRALCIGCAHGSLRSQRDDGLAGFRLCLCDVPDGYGFLDGGQGRGPRADLAAEAASFFDLVVREQRSGGRMAQLGLGQSNELYLGGFCGGLAGLCPLLSTGASSFDCPIGRR